MVEYPTPSEHPGNADVSQAIQDHDQPYRSAHASPALVSPHACGWLHVVTWSSTVGFVLGCVAVDAGEVGSIPCTLFVLLSFLVVVSAGLLNLVRLPVVTIDDALQSSMGIAFVSSFMNLFWDDTSGNLISQLLTGIGFCTVCLYRLSFGPWQEMVIFIPLGFFFFMQIALAVIAYGGRSNESHTVAAQLVSIGVALPAVLFGSVHYFKKMQSPWLDTPNFPCYAFSTFLILMCYNCAYWANRGIKGYDHQLDGMLLLSRCALPVVFALMSMSIYRNRMDIEHQVEHRFFLSESMFPALWSLRSSMTGGWLLLAGAFGMLVLRCVNWDDLDSMRYFEATGRAILSLACFILSVATLQSSMQTRKWMVPGYCAIAIGLLISSWNGGHGREASFRIISIMCACAGGLCILMSSFTCTDRTMLVTPNPSSWQHIWSPVHSCTLLGLFLPLAGITDHYESFHIASVASYVIAATVQLIFGSICWSVFSATHGAKIHTRKEEQVHVPFDATLATIEECDVLICGASISGLMLASQLGRGGVQTILIEPRTALIEDARFMFANAASSGIYSRVLDLDLISELHSRAVPNTAPMGIKFIEGMFQNDSRLITEITSIPPHELEPTMGSMDLFTESLTFGCRYATRHGLRIMQSHQETVLYKQVTRFSCIDKRYGHKFIGFSEPLSEEKAASSVVECIADKIQSLVHSRYVIGADGPSSAVSVAIGSTFSGLMNLARPKITLIKSPVLLEYIIKKHGFSHQFWIFRQGIGGLQMVPADAARAIFTANVVFGYGTWKGKHASEIASAILGTSDFEILGDSYYYWNFFIADRFSRANAFLVGDAAHSWPPHGGTGGNTAFGDVFNLGWKLCYAVHHTHTSGLLNSYDCERRQYDLKIGLMVQQKARVMGSPQQAVNFVCSRWFWMYRKIIECMVLQAGCGRARATAGFQFGLQLSVSPIIFSDKTLQDDPHSEYLPRIAPGAYLPDFLAKNRQFVHSMVHHTWYTIVVNVAASFKRDVRGAQLIANDIFVRFQQLQVPVHIVEMNLAAPHRAAAGRHEVVARLYSEQEVIIVRPDLRVAWNRRVTDPPHTPQHTEKLVSILCAMPSSSNEGASWSKRQSVKAEAYLSFLVDKFSKNSRPLLWAFPNALYLKGTTKAAAISAIKKVAQDFKATTKDMGSIAKQHDDHLKA